MNIEKTWQSSPVGDGMLERLLQQEAPTSRFSQHPLTKLRQNLAIGMGFAVLITIGYAFMMVSHIPWQIRIVVALLILFNLIILADSLRLYRSIPESIQPSRSVREVLETTDRSFRRSWDIQRRLSLFVYPVAATGGFILGWSEGSGKKFESIVNHPVFLPSLLLTLAVVVPLAYYLGKWMFHSAYGRHLERIRQMIRELDGE